MPIHEISQLHIFIGFHYYRPPFRAALLNSALGYRSPMAYEHAMEVQPTEA